AKSPEIIVVPFPHKYVFLTLLFSFLNLLKKSEYSIKFISLKLSIFLLTMSVSEVRYQSSNL
ncbi:unnamed protein product, partial [Larinioides sclopetarius]